MAPIAVATEVMTHSPMISDGNDTVDQTGFIAVHKHVSAISQ